MVRLGGSTEPSRAPADHHQERHRLNRTGLLHKLDEVRRARWTEVVESVDFTHSSCKAAWQTINKLTGSSTMHSRCPVTANAIASQVLNNGAVTGLPVEERGRFSRS